MMKKLINGLERRSIPEGWVLQNICTLRSLPGFVRALERDNKVEITVDSDESLSRLPAELNGKVIEGIVGQRVQRPNSLSR